MKTIGLFRHQTSLKGLLALAISSIALLTSWSKEDNTVTPSPDPQTIQLNGTWYCVYDGYPLTRCESGRLANGVGCCLLFL